MPINNLTLFHGLNTEQIDAINSILDFCRFPRDFVIFRQGQTADYLYILCQGKVEIRYKPYDGPVLTIAHINSDDVFGWSAAMVRDAYTATAITIVDSKTYRINNQDMYRLCQKYPDIGRILLQRLSSGIAKRIQSTQTEVLSILYDKMNLR